MGSEGLEPSPTWLRARHAAASTLIPHLCFLLFRSARTMGAEGVEPSSGPYKRPALTVELRAIVAITLRVMSVMRAAQRLC